MRVGNRIKCRKDISFFQNLEDKFFIATTAMDALRQLNKFPTMWKRYSNKIDKGKMLDGI